MKEKYILLEKEYSAESLYDLDRDVSEIHDFPKDSEYKKIKNDEPEMCGFLGGTYQVQIVYIPDPDNGDKITD